MKNLKSIKRTHCVRTTNGSMFSCGRKNAMNMRSIIVIWRKFERNSKRNNWIFYLIRINNKYGVKRNFSILIVTISTLFMTHHDAQFSFHASQQCSQHQLIGAHDTISILITALYIKLPGIYTGYVTAGHAMVWASYYEGCFPMLWLGGKDLTVRC